jgi:hypothetical protein
VFSVFTSRCLVAASNDGRFLSSGFPNVPRPQLPASQFSQLQLSTGSTTELQGSAVVLSPVYTAVTCAMGLHVTVCKYRGRGHITGLWYVSPYTCNGKQCNELSCIRKEPAAAMFSMRLQNFSQGTEARHNDLRIASFWVEIWKRDLPQTKYVSASRSTATSGSNAVTTDQTLGWMTDL